MEVLGRYWRSRAGTRDHVFPANGDLAACPVVPARARACPSSCTRLVPAQCCLFSKRATYSCGGGTKRAARQFRSTPTLASNVLTFKDALGAQRVERSSPRVIGCASA